MSFVKEAALSQSSDRSLYVLDMDPMAFTLVLTAKDAEPQRIRVKHTELDELMALSKAVVPDRISNW